MSTKLTTTAIKASCILKQNIEGNQWVIVIIMGVNYELIMISCMNELENKE